MFIKSTEREAVIGNGLAQIQARGVNEALDLSVSAIRNASAPVVVLKRGGQNKTTGPWQVEVPERCTFRVDQTSHTAALVISGKLGGADYFVALRITEGGPWVQVSELLCLDELQPNVAVDWFEAVWQFADWREPGEVFSPLLVPQPGDVVGRHVMRAPALVAQSGGVAATMVYSVDSIYRAQALPACMNLLRDGSQPIFRVGLRPHRVRGHVYFTYAPAPARQARFHFSYHLYVGTDLPPGAALEVASRKLWSAYGTRSLKCAPELPLPWEEYARQIYPRVFEQRWAETQLNGRRVGAVRINRSYPNDVWMCPWFSQARSAYGLYLWGQWLDQPDWVERAVATRDLHLAAPQHKGLFRTVFVFGTTPERCRWVDSHHQGGGPGIYHLMDMSWTVYQLLRWHRDLVPDERTIEFARRYGRGILALQRDDGGFPAYVDATHLQPVSRVDKQALVAHFDDFSLVLSDGNRRR